MRNESYYKLKFKVTSNPVTCTHVIKHTLQHFQHFTLNPPVQLREVYSSLISMRAEDFIHHLGPTHRSRARIRYPSLIFYPSVVGPLLVSVRSVKHGPDVGHAVHTHSWAPENGAEGKDRRTGARVKARTRVDVHVIDYGHTWRWWRRHRPSGFCHLWWKAWRCPLPAGRRRNEGKAFLLCRSKFSKIGQVLGQVGAQKKVLL